MFPMSWLRIHSSLEKETMDLITMRRGLTWPKKKMKVKLPWPQKELKEECKENLCPGTSGSSGFVAEEEDKCSR